MTNSDTKTSAMGRRSFMRAAALAAAAPILTEASLAYAQTSAVPSGMALHGQGPNVPPPGSVLINANENPLGPSASAIEAITKIAPTGGRYDRMGETEMLQMTFAQQHGLKKENVAVYAGSSEPLHYSVLCFTSPTKSFVTADPSYEAGMMAAMVTKAPIKKVPLTANYAHDVKAMVAADPNAGVIYICNPNNPTGTTTLKEDIVWALDNKPAGAILLVDEAYIHLSDAKDVLDMVAAGKDLIVLRTFSKIYGMAGIRCGFAVARPDLLAKLQPFGQNAMPITGSAAARASLLDPELIPTRKKLIAATRNDTLQWLKAKGYKVYGAPESNCFMVETGAAGKAVFEAMKAKGVYIGRTWPVWPTAVRLSLGTPEEMDKFKVAWTEVMANKSALAMLGAALPPAVDPLATHGFLS